MDTPTVECPAMPRQTTDKKKAISLTLSAKSLDELRAIGADTPFPPPISQLVDAAIKEYVQRHRRHAPHAAAKRK